MMAEKDPYGVLGVSKGASDGEIKRAFRKKARQFHPDRNPGDATSEAKFKEVQSAYDKIGDAESRHEHDQQEQMANMFGGGRRGGSQFGGSQRPRSQKRAKGSDITVGLDITMEEAANGGTFSFTFKRLKSNSAGTMEAASTSLKTKLEPSVKHGAIRRLKGQGHDHPEGDSGDVILTVRIDAGEGRSWDGGIMIQEVPITYSTLLLGGKVKVTLPSGKEGLLNISANSQIGDRRRMGKAGYLGGDLELEFVLIETDELNQQQLDALEKLKQSGL